jgi:hypothetical protein
MRKLIPLALITLLVIGGLVWFLNPRNLPPDRGQEGFLQPSFVALDEGSFSLLKQAVDRNDAELFASLQSSRRVFRVTERVRVRALTEMDAELMQVEILEGEFAGRTGWVQGAWLHRQ